MTEQMISRRVTRGYNEQQSRKLLAQLRREHSEKTLQAALAYHEFVSSTKDAAQRVEP